MAKRLKVPIWLLNVRGQKIHLMVPKTPLKGHRDILLACLKGSYISLYRPVGAAKARIRWPGPLALLLPLHPLLTPPHSAYAPPLFP